MRDKPKEFGGTIPWTRIEDIEGKYLNDSKSKQYVSEKTIKAMNLKIIPKGSLIVSISATFGTIAIITNDLITNQTFIGLVPSNYCNVNFLFQLCSSPLFLMKLKKISAGSTIFYISKDDFKSIDTYLPKMDEQNKVSITIDNVDNLITLHQRKYNNVVKENKNYDQFN